MKKGHLIYFLFFVLAAAGLLPALSAGFYFYGSAQSLIDENSEEKIKYYASLVSDQITDYAERNGTLVSALFASLARGAAGGQNISAHDLAAVAPDLTGAALLDAEGAETALIGVRPRADYGEIWPAVYKTCIEDGRLFTGAIRKNLYRRQLLLNMAFPVDGDLQNRSCAVAEFNMQPLERGLARLPQPDMLMLVFTKSGFLIYSSKEGLAVTVSDNYKDKLATLAAQAGQGGLPSVLRDKGRTGILTQNPATQWLVYQEQSSTAAARAAALFKAGYKRIILFAAAALLLVLLLTFWLWSAVIRPVKIITKAVNIAEGGDVSTLPALPAPDNEIGSLALAFARMLDSIKLKLDAFAQDRQELEEINQSLELRVGSRTRELRTALGELIKKERLAAIGQMASIVSHEIRNPLAVMANALYLIKARLGENADERVLKNISVIEQEIKQANGIIEEILGYARSREQILAIVDLNLYVREILASYPMPQNIKTVAEYSPQRPRVRIDAEEMKQALRNIIANSVEVMPEGGRLMVKTKIEGEGALVSVRDTGPGIPADIQERIFDPFFTTKARGTGLGLAVVKKVAARNEADIILQSEAGKGTKISIVFKLYKEEH
ncbi:MAG: HAMP domain-containing protein [Elusimicrobiota bacterium]|jgi:signal transduction histidine kinase|nr:HAMP domain-containing protein [Elusimicrobiota bacterium]